MVKVSAIVLGGGLSRRMGEENKLFLPIKGKPMIGWVIEQVKASNASDVVLVGSALSTEKLREFLDVRIEVVDNPDYKTGMTSSIQAGVQAARGDGYMICLGDQPNIRTDTYDQLIDVFENTPNSIVLPYYQGTKGNPVIFPKAYREEILKHPHPEGCKELIQENWQQVVKVEVHDTGVLLDVDTPSDYEQL